MSANTAGNPEAVMIGSAEAAKMAGMGINQFRREVKAGNIPAIWLGNRIRVPREKFLKFLNGELDMKKAS